MEWPSQLKHIGKNGSKDEKKPILSHTYGLEKGYSETAVDVDDDIVIQNTTVFNNLNDTSQSTNKIKNNYFNDGVSKIDFVLVYEEKNIDMEIHNSSNSEEIKSTYSQNLALHKKWRKKFIKNLRLTGIELEMDESTSTEKTVHYVKVHCPWNVLVHYAEELCLRAPLQLRLYKNEHWSGSLLSKFKLPNFMEANVPTRPQLYFTCPFKKSKLHKFLGNENRDTYFSDTDRSLIANEILQTVVFGKKKRAELGVDRLLSECVFSAAFPLHSGPYKHDKDSLNLNESTFNERQILFDYWARWGRWYKYQPLDHIRHYFGEKIGMYFAWLGFYTSWLLPVALIGLIIFIIGAATMEINTPALEICSSEGNFTMCPLCPLCSTWFLSKTCLMAKLSHLFDNGGTVFFATLMSFWAVFFLEFWKRKCAELGHHWEVMNFEEEEERPRPEYNARAPTLELNPITGVLEPHFSPKQRLKRILTGFGILVIMLAIVIIFVISVIIYRGIIGIVLLHSNNKVIHGQATIMQSLTGAIINLVLIMLMANVYTAVAEWLTKWEMHRTQTDFENSLTFKVFIFQFVNYYSSIFYIAFFKGKLVGYPGHYLTTFGIRNESCGSGGCLIELAQQLFVIMVGKQAINNVQELVIPKLKQWWQRRKMKELQRDSLDHPSPSWKIDYEELINFEGLFDEYLEMVLQFGFITIFVAAFPLAPLFALLNNWIEIRLDARKLICETRRPVAVRAQNIGIWYEILDSLVQIAVITNAFLIAFTSEFIPRLLYTSVVGGGSLKGYTNFTLSYAPNGSGLQGCRYNGYRDNDGHLTLYYYQLLASKLAFVIIFEHIVFFIGRMIDWGVPDIPESLQLKVKRENYLAKQALADNI